MTIDTPLATQPGPRARIVAAAADLLRESGPASVTTRGVAARAGVQPPAIYRVFGDKDGLLEAVAEHVMADFVTAKSAVVEAAVAGDVDPLEDLRAGWDAQIEFGVANPTLFRLLSDPDRVRSSRAALSGRQVLESRVRRVAAIGRLRVGEDRAVGLIQSAGVGTIQTLLAAPRERRDPGLADAMWDAVAAAILIDAAPHPVERPRAAAITLRATTSGQEVLSGAERELLAEWLDRIIAPRPS